MGDDVSVDDDNDSWSLVDNEMLAVFGVLQVQESVATGFTVVVVDCDDARAFMD